MRYGYEVGPNGESIATMTEEKSDDQTEEGKMKLHRVSWDDKFGNHDRWLPSKAAAVSFRHKTQDVPRTAMIAEVEVPTTKTELIEWLNNGFLATNMESIEKFLG